MTKRILFLAAVLLLATPASAAYLSAVNDLPLPPGLSEDLGATTSFDTPAGRLVEATGRTQDAAESVLKFYDSSLPPLGWTVLGAGVFTRGDETLKVEAEAKDGATVVRFTLAPKG